MRKRGCQGDDMSRFMDEYLSGKYPAGYWEWVAAGMVDEGLSDRARKDGNDGARP